MDKVDELSGIIACMLESQDMVWCDDALVYVQHAVDKGYGEYVALCCNADNTPQGSHKTRLMIQSAAHNILLGNNIIYVTAEMESSEIYSLIVKAILGEYKYWESIDSEFAETSKSIYLTENIKSIKLKHPDFVSHVYRELESCINFGKLYVMDTTKVSQIEDIISHLESVDNSIQRKSGNPEVHLDVVYLDYLGILGVPKEVMKKTQDEQGKYRASMAKSRLALEFNGRGIVVVSAHQVNREGQKRSDAKKDIIRSYDMSESGWIERYADTAVVLQKKEGGIVQIHTVKSRRSDDIPPFEVLLDKKKLLLKESITADVSFSTSILAIT